MEFEKNLTFKSRWSSRKHCYCWSSYFISKKLKIII
jgi:hypothetical protein